MAWVEWARGHHRDAIAAAHRALQLDPVTPARYTELAWVLALGGRHAEAMREVERALQLNAQSFESHLMKGWIFEQLGKPDAAFAAYRDAQRFGGAPEDALRNIDAAYRAEGLPGYYRGWLERSGRAGIISETSRARLYMEVGQLDRALEALKRVHCCSLPLSGTLILWRAIDTTEISTAKLPLSRVVVAASARESPRSSRFADAPYM